MSSEVELGLVQPGEGKPAELPASQRVRLNFDITLELPNKVKKAKVCSRVGVVTLCADPEVVGACTQVHARLHMRDNCMVTCAFVSVCTCRGVATCAFVSVCTCRGVATCRCVHSCRLGVVGFKRPEDSLTDTPDPDGGGEQRESPNPLGRQG